MDNAVLRLKQNLFLDLSFEQNQRLVWQPRNSINYYELIIRKRKYIYVTQTLIIFFTYILIIIVQVKVVLKLLLSDIVKFMTNLFNINTQKTMLSSIKINRIN